VHHREDFGEVAAALVGEEAEAVVGIAAAAIAAAGQVAYPMLAAADGVAAIVPGSAPVLGDGIDLNIQHLALMAEVAVALAIETEEEIGGLVPEHSRTEGGFPHEVDTVA
jgi:hypothetical protein